MSSSHGIRKRSPWTQEVRDLPFSTREPEESTIQKSVYCCSILKDLFPDPAQRLRLSMRDRDTSKRLVDPIHRSVHKFLHSRSRIERHCSSIQILRCGCALAGEDFIVMAVSSAFFLCGTEALSLLLHLCVRFSELRLVCG